MRVEAEIFAIESGLFSIMPQHGGRIPSPLSSRCSAFSIRPHVTHVKIGAYALGRCECRTPSLSPHLSILFQQLHFRLNGPAEAPTRERCERQGTSYRTARMERPNQRSECKQCDMVVTWWGEGVSWPKCSSKLRQHGDFTSAAQKIVWVESRISWLLLAKVN